MYTKNMKKQTQNIAQRTVQKIKRDNEFGARKGVLEDLFNDFHANRIEDRKSVV